MTPERLAEIKTEIAGLVLNGGLNEYALGLFRELVAEAERLQQVVNDVWFIAESGATDYIPAEKRQELLESIARRTRG